MLERKKKYPKNVLNGAKTLQFITANRKKQKQKKENKCRRVKVQNRGVVTIYIEKIRKIFFFKKVQNYGN